MKIITQYMTRLIRWRPLQHLAFWAVSFTVLVRFFRVSAEVQEIDVIFTALFHLSLILAVYVNNYLIAKYLASEKIIHYLVFSVINLLIFAAINHFLFADWIDFFLPDYYFISYYTYPELLLFVGSYMLLAGLIQISRGWFRLRELEQEKIATELHALKMQVNPHFLFNSLNSIYSLTLLQPDRAPQAVLKLSGLLRFLLYEAQADRIPLEKELALLQDYIDLQQLRIPAGKADIQLQIVGDVAEVEMAPLLLLPLLENAFKHGVKAENRHSFVHVRIEIDGQIRVTMRNNVGKIDEIVQDSQGGIGLVNVRKRLELLYPNAHQLQVRSDGEIFEVKLQIGV